MNWFRQIVGGDDELGHLPRMPVRCGWYNNNALQKPTFLTGDKMFHTFIRYWFFKKRSHSFPPLYCQCWARPEITSLVKESHPWARGGGSSYNDNETTNLVFCSVMHQAYLVKALKAQGRHSWTVSNGKMFGWCGWVPYIWNDETM